MKRGCAWRGLGFWRRLSISGARYLGRHRRIDVRRHRVSARRRRRRADGDVASGVHRAVRGAGRTVHSRVRRDRRLADPVLLGGHGMVAGDGGVRVPLGVSGHIPGTRASGRSGGQHRWCLRALVDPRPRQRGRCRRDAQPEAKARVGRRRGGRAVGRAGRLGDAARQPERVAAAGPADSCGRGAGQHRAGREVGCGGGAGDRRAAHRASAARCWPSGATSSCGRNLPRRSISTANPRRPSRAWRLVAQARTPFIIGTDEFQDAGRRALLQRGRAGGAGRPLAPGRTGRWRLCRSGACAAEAGAVFRGAARAKPSRTSARGTELWSSSTWAGRGA